MPDQNSKADRRKPNPQQERLTQRLSQVNKANQDPLNQAALRWLQKAHAEISDGSQYCLQLMQWGLEQGLRFPNRRQTEMFKATLIEFEADQNQLTFLSYLKGPPEEPRVTDVDLLTASDKHQAAWVLIDSLDSKLSSEPGNNGIYPPQDPLRLPGD